MRFSHFLWMRLQWGPNLFSSALKGHGGMIRPPVVLLKFYLNCLQKDLPGICQFHPQIHTRASLKESKGYPPPEKFSVEIPPLQEGYSLAKYSPLWKILGQFSPQNERIPPLKLVKFSDSPP